jgi:hypothetical protein
MKLRARVPCRRLFYDAYDNHTWGPVAEDGAQEGSASCAAAEAAAA